MAVVTSLTAERILELASEWQGLPAEQEDLRALITMLQAYLDENQTQLIELNEQTLPALFENLQSNQNALSDLNDNVLVDLRATLDQNALALQNIQEVDLPDLNVNMQGISQLTRERPKVFVQPDPPPPYDDLEDRDLVHGDTWIDTNDGNKQRIWTGAEWSDLAVNVADFSLTVRKFLTTTHQIY